MPLRQSSRLLAAVLVCLIAPISTALAQQISEQELKRLTDQAAQGDMQAQLDLAERYHAGDGVKQDAKEALFWYKKLADSGVAQAQLTLGLMYIRGDGIDQNNQQALHWLNLAAEQRLASAQYLLGLAHAEGHGVEVDKVKAYMWYEISAAMNYQDAIEARDALAQQMSQEQLTYAEQMATEWWMQFHH